MEGAILILGVLASLSICINRGVAELFHARGK